MPKFNGDVIFIDGSGQVRAVHGDLTLRANEAGGGHIIVGSGDTLRPEADCNSSEPIDLGLDFLRWNTLYACSGNFLQRPTVNGSGVLLQGEAAEGGDGGVDTAVQVIRSTDFSPTKSFSNITFDTTSVETNPSALEHNDSSTERIDIHVSGLYEIQFTTRLRTDGAGDIYSSRVLVNNTTVVSGTEYSERNSNASADATFSFSCITHLNVEDFITLQMQASNALGEVGSGMTLSVIKLDGVPGVEGPPGADGAPGGVTTIEGLAGVVDLDSPDGTVFIGVDGQTIELTVLPDEGQTSIESISGLIDLDSPDESININVNGQAIELTAPSGYAPSGASYILVDYNDNNHLVDARVLSATSGIRLADQGARSTSGMAITLDFDNEPTLNQILSWNGQKLEWVDDQAGGGGGVSNVEMVFSPASGKEFVLEHGLNATSFAWAMWLTHDKKRDLDPILSMIPETVSPSGVNHAIIGLKKAVSGLVTFVG